MAHTVFVITGHSGAATQEMKDGFTSKGIVSRMCFWMILSEPSDRLGEIPTPMKAGQTSDPDAFNARDVSTRKVATSVAPAIQS